MNYDYYLRNDNNELIKSDLTIWGTIIIVSNLVYSKIKNKDPFDLDWRLYAMSSLFGIVIHSLFTSKITIYIIKKFNIINYNIKLSILDTIKWSTIFICNNIIISYFKNKEIIFNNEWFSINSSIIIGYIIFNLLIEKDVFNISKNNPDLMISIIKSAIGIFIGYYMSDMYVHIDFIHMLLSIEIALITYYVIVQKLIPSILL